MKIQAEVHQSQDLIGFLAKLGSPELQKAGAIGLNEHAAEQRRQSVTRITAYTGAPKSRVGGKTTLIKAAPGASMQATIRTKDAAITLAEYGSPVWVRDLSPGWKGGSVSSMAGAQATGWNVRRTFKGSFVAKGQVMKRTASGLKVLYMAVLPNELAKPSRPNVPAAQKFAQYDLEKRVMNQVIRVLGT